MRFTADMAALRAKRLTDGKLVPPPGLAPVLFYRCAEEWEWEEALNRLVEILKTENWTS